MRKLVVGLLLAALVGAVWRWHLRQERIETALAYGQLAGLPADATRVEVTTEGGLFARTFWLRFQTSEAGLSWWLGKSPALAEMLGGKLPEGQCLPPQTPAWFTPPAIRPGQRQVFRLQEENAVYGTVWVDRQTHTVYLVVSRS